MASRRAVAKKSPPSRSSPLPPGRPHVPPLPLSALRFSSRQSPPQLWAHARRRGSSEGALRDGCTAVRGLKHVSHSGLRTAQRLPVRPRTYQKSSPAPSFAFGIAPAVTRTLTGRLIAAAAAAAPVKLAIPSSRASSPLGQAQQLELLPCASRDWAAAQLADRGAPRCSWCFWFTYPAGACPACTTDCRAGACCLFRRGLAAVGCVARTAMYGRGHGSTCSTSSSSPRRRGWAPRGLRFCVAPWRRLQRLLDHRRPHACRV